MRKTISVIAVLILCLLVITTYSRAATANISGAVTGNFVGDGGFSYFSITMEKTSQSTALGTMDLNKGTFFNSNNRVSGTFEATGFTKDGTPLLFFDWDILCPGGFFLTITPQPNNSDKLDVNVLSSIDCHGEAVLDPFTMSRK